MGMPLCELKERLKIGLDKREMKPIELAEKTNISKSAISQYLSGYAKPKQDRIYLLSKALSVDPAWLMGFDVPMETKTGGILNNYDIASYASRLRTDENAQRLLQLYYENLDDDNKKRLLDLAEALGSR